MILHPTRRGFLQAMAAAAVVPAIAGPTAAEAAGFQIPAEPPNLGSHYHRARRTFQTHLIDKGPAPDRYESLKAPPGADEIFYRSRGIGGDFELAAWVSRYKRARTGKPAVLFLHGGNALGRGHWSIVKPFIEQGYVVMIPTVRGENGQKGVFSGFYNEVDDVLAAAERLQHLPGVDPNRLFLAGHSIGGTLAMLAAMTSRRFRACAPFSGNPDAWAFFNRYPQDIRFDTSDPREFQMRSAICWVPSLKCPIRLTHGTMEGHFDDRLDLFAKRAREAKIRVETAIVPGGHTSALPEEVAQSIKFFQSVAA